MKHKLTCLIYMGCKCHLVDLELPEVKKEDQEDNVEELVWGEEE